MLITTINSVDLHLFGEGGEGANAAVEGQNAPKGDNTLAKAQQAPKSGEYADVVFGKQATSSETDGSTQPTPEADNPAEEVKEELKEFTRSDVDSIVRRRVNDFKPLKEYKTNTEPILDMLCDSMGIERGNYNLLSERLKNDEDYRNAREARLEREADEAGVTVEQYKEIDKLRRENENFKALEEQQRSEAEFNQKALRWSEEIKEAQAAYPNFDPRAETSNPRFRALIDAGVSVKQAYEVAHLDEIKNNVATSTAQQTEKQVVDTIRAKGSRPVESGTSSKGGIRYKTDVSKLTKADRAEIVRRVQMGAHIEL